MEFDHIEFTMEEILTIHQAWIAKLYVEDRKTEAEITQLLSEQKLIVTLEQVQKCIKDWNLQPQPTYPSIPALDELLSTFYTTQPNRLSHPSSSSSVSKANYTPRIFNNPENCPSTKAPHFSLNITPIHAPDQDRYKTRPLPPIPDTPVLPAAKHVKQCAHGFPAHQCTEIRTCLAALPKSGPSSLDLYRDTLQSHEKIALSLSKGNEKRADQNQNEISRQELSNSTKKDAAEAKPEGNEIVVVASTPIISSDDGEYELDVLGQKFLRAGDSKVGRGREDLPIRMRMRIRKSKGDGAREGELERKRKRRESEEDGGGGSERSGGYKGKGKEREA